MCTSFLAAGASEPGGSCGESGAAAALNRSFPSLKETQWASLSAKATKRAPGLRRVSPGSRDGALPPFPERVVCWLRPSGRFCCVLGPSTANALWPLAPPFTCHAHVHRRNVRVRPNVEAPQVEVSRKSIFWRMNRFYWGELLAANVAATGRRDERRPLLLG